MTKTCKRMQWRKVGRIYLLNLNFCGVWIFTYLLIYNCLEKLNVNNNEDCVQRKEKYKRLFQKTMHDRYHIYTRKIDIVTGLHDHDVCKICFTIFSEFITTNV